MAGVEADEGGEEGCGGGGEVEDEVGEGFGFAAGGWWWGVAAGRSGSGGFLPGGGGERGMVLFGGVGGKEALGCCGLDEGAAVGTEGADEIGDLVVCLFFVRGVLNCV